MKFIIDKEDNPERVQWFINSYGLQGLVDTINKELPKEAHIEKLTAITEDGSFNLHLASNTYRTKEGRTCQFTARQNINGLPYCCGSAFAYGMQVYTTFQNYTKIYEILLDWTRVYCECNEYTEVMYITADYQDFLIDALNAQHFEPIHTYINLNSGNKVTYWVKQMRTE